MSASSRAVRLALGAGVGCATVFMLLGAALLGVLGGQGAPGPGASLTCAASAAGRQAVPASLLALYEGAAAANQLGGRGVFVLAAINAVETDFGRNVAVSSAGAVGWMQFMPATWSAYGRDGDGDGRANPDDPHDAIPSAARYLAASGAPGDWYRAIFAYNHADWYVHEVMDLADRYQGTCVADPPPLASSSPSGQLAWPVAGPITSPFGMRWGRLHAGIDIAAPAGTPVLAPAPGVVTVAGWSGGYGNRVCLRHSVALTTCAAHLAELFVNPGTQAAGGQAIGTVGCTGHCFGDHLHFEVRLGADPTSRPVDPLPYLSGPLQ